VTHPEATELSGPRGTEYGHVNEMYDFVRSRNSGFFSERYIENVKRIKCPLYE
jgi:hypothetical protein